MQGMRCAARMPVSVGRSKIGDIDSKHLCFDNGYGYSDHEDSHRPTGYRSRPRRVFEFRMGVSEHLRHLYGNAGLETP
jgi:Rps23 Pro-64 3,4-dihydroxylase Tpa1-like proline 4-hydroxylase